MQARHRDRASFIRGAAAVVSLAAGAAAHAAPLAYETAVNADSPYVYYRLQETGTLTDAPANESSPNNRADGIYRGDPTGSAAGYGTGSDTAVSFPGTSDTGLDYLRTTDARTFGSQTPHSSYEFVFKSNVANPTVRQGLFAVFNASSNNGTPGDTSDDRTQNQAVSLELSTANANNAFNAATTRMYVRDESGLLVFGNIAHGNLLDGNYHHFVVTVDLSAANVSDKIKAYVDGFAVNVGVSQSAGGAPTDFRDFTVDPTFAAQNVRGTVGLEANVTIDEAALYGTVLNLSDIQAHAIAAGFPVPEPGSLALAGMAGLGLLARRRRA